MLSTRELNRYELPDWTGSVDLTPLGPTGIQQIEDSVLDVSIEDDIPNSTPVAISDRHMEVAWTRESESRACGKSQPLSQFVMSWSLAVTLAI